MSPSWKFDLFHTRASWADQKHCLRSGLSFALDVNQSGCPLGALSSTWWSLGGFVMKKGSQLFASAMYGLWTSLLASVLLSSGAAMAQQADYDPEWFDCFGVRRDGSLLLLWEGSGLAAVLTEFSCVEKSCVSREVITETDGTASETFWHLYFPEGAHQYISTRTRWTQNVGAPESHRVNAVPLRDCFTMTPDSELSNSGLGRGALRRRRSACGQPDWGLSSGLFLRTDPLPRRLVERHSDRV